MEIFVKFPAILLSIKKGKPVFTTDLPCQIFNLFIEYLSKQ